MAASNRHLRSIIHLGALWAVAVAHPLFETLARAPEFFIAHRATAADLITLAAAVGLLPVVALGASVFLTGLIGRRAGDALAACLIGALAGLTVVQMGYRVGLEGWAGSAPVAVVGSALAGGAWLRVPLFGTFLSFLSPAIVVVPVVFLMGPGVRPLVWPGEAAAAAAQAEARSVPVVMVIFDELPLVSLLDASERIDAHRYPNLAALAADAIWFRNATTVSDFTGWAIPAILTGRYPDPKALPRLDDHQQNLFTILEPTHGFEVVEQRSALCPAELCREPEPLAPLRGLTGMLSDLRVVAAHLLLPPAARAGLPDLTKDWAGFGEVTESSDEARRRDQAARIRAFVRGIERDDSQPTLYFIHSLVSHHPGRWVPSGQAIANLREIPGLRDVWTRAEWPVVQYYQRHLWQVGFVDTLVGELRARLRETGLYDRALIVITADHGISFQPGSPRRHFREHTAGEILPVPLIVKLPAGTPGPRPGTIGDGNVQTIDILPTIAAVLGIQVPGPVEGRSLLDGRPDTAEKRMYFSRARRVRLLEVAQVVDQRRAAVQRKLALFGNSRWPVAQVPALRRLVGRSVESLTIENRRAGLRVVIDDPGAFENVDPEAAELPAEVSGRIRRGGRRIALPVYLAVALNGVVVATTQTWPRSTQWIAAVPVDGLRPGRNEVEVFRVDPAAPERLVGLRSRRR